MSYHESAVCAFVFVRRKLKGFCFLEQRISCAAVSQDSITFQFHGTPCVWDGETIKKKIKGNSVLYIVMEYDQVCLQLFLKHAKYYKICEE